MTATKIPTTGAEDERQSYVAAPAFDVYDPNTRPDQYATLVFVTRVVALSLLEANHGNRRISEMHVRIWQERFNRRRYRLTHQGIAIDHDGLLEDAQHRLLGFLRSDCDGFWTMITYNVDRASFAAIDGGILRAPAQLIEGSYAEKKIAAARLLTKYPRISHPSARVDTEEQLETYSQLREHIDAAVELASPVYRQTKINIPLLAAVLTIPISTGYDSHKVTTFVRGLTEGAGLDSDDPRLALRNRYTVEAAHLNKSDRLAGSYYIIKAWNAHARGEKLTKLQRPRGSKVTNDALPEVEA